MAWRKFRASVIRRKQPRRAPTYSASLRPIHHVPDTFSDYFIGVQINDSEGTPCNPVIPFFSGGDVIIGHAIARLWAFGRSSFKNVIVNI